MKLQILVPQYKETDEMVKPLLDSIAIQQAVDFNEIGIIIKAKFNHNNIILVKYELKHFKKLLIGYDIEYH